MRRKKIRGTTQIAACAATQCALMQRVHSAFTENSQVEFGPAPFARVSTIPRSLCRNNAAYFVLTDPDLRLFVFNFRYDSTIGFRMQEHSCQKVPQMY